MENINGIISRIPARRSKTWRQEGNIVYSKPVVSMPPRTVDEECPRCHSAGFTRNDEYGEYGVNKTIETPCPDCLGRRRAHEAATKQANLVYRLFGGPQIPHKAESWQFDTFPSDGDQDARTVVEDFVRIHKDGKDESEKRGLYIAGRLGRGKTGLSICALKEFIQAGQLSLFVSSPDLMDRLRSSMDRSSGDSQDELLKVVTEVPFLALDDLGVEKPTTYVLEKFYLIIDKRQSRGLYTLFTSNLSTKDLEAYWRPSDVEPGLFHPGMRIVERIREYCQGVSIRGGNLRDAGW
jgi:DNA replication protein